MQRGQLQLVRDSADGRWSIYRWSLDDDKVLDVIGPFTTRERAAHERLHLLAKGTDILYKPKSQRP